MTGRQPSESSADPFNSTNNVIPANAPRAPAGFRALEETNTLARTRRAARHRFFAASERRAGDQFVNPRRRATRSRSNQRRVQAEPFPQDALSVTEMSALDQSVGNKIDGSGGARASADPSGPLNLPNVKYTAQHDIDKSAEAGADLGHSAQQKHASPTFRSPRLQGKGASYSQSQEASPASGHQGHFRNVNSTSPSLAEKVSQHSIPQGGPSTPTRASFKPAAGQTKGPSVFSPHAPNFRPAAGGNDHLAATEVEWMAHMGLGPLSCRACGADMSCEVDGVTLRCEKCRRTR